MKNLLLFTVSTLLSCSLTAQNYTFELKQENYVPLTNATELTIGENWDDDEAELIPFPFPFKIFNSEPVNTVVIDSDFTLSFIAGANIFHYSAGGYDFEYKPGCSVKYKVEGNMPNRIFKVEYNQVGFYAAGATEYFTGQIWVQENGCMSSHIGPYQSDSDMYMDSGDFSIFAINMNIFAVAGGTLDNSFYFETNMSGLIGMEDDSLSIQGIPPVNSVFEFCPTPFLSVKEINSKDQVKVYPNPSTDFITVQSNQGKMLNRIDVVSMDGKVCATEINITDNQMQLDLSSLSKGIYILQTYFIDGSMSVNKITRQ